MRNVWTVALGLGAIPAGVVALALLALRGGAPPVVEPGNAPPTPAPKAARDERGWVGVLVSRDSVDVAARVEGVVSEVRVRLGDSVAAGDILARLDTAGLRDDLSVATAGLRAARAEAEKAALETREAAERLERRRPESERRTSAISEEDLASAQYDARYASQRLEAARARVAEGEARTVLLTRRVAEATLRAPFDGNVTERYVSPGATVAAGSPIVRLVSAGVPRVRFAIPVERAGTVSVGDRLEVQVPELQPPLEGVVENIAPEADPVARVVVAEGRLRLASGAQSGGLAGRAVRVRVGSEPGRPVESGPPATDPKEDP